MLCYLWSYLIIYITPQPQLIFVINIHINPDMVLSHNVMANIQLEVVKSTASTKGGHILKLQHKESKSIETPFGKKTQESQETYYMKVDNPGTVGFKAELDLSQFRIIERDFKVEDPNSDLNGQTIQLKWLSL